jgi:hypothetical protein
LQTVPSCRQCNHGASLDEEYFKEFVLRRDDIPQTKKVKQLQDSIFRAAMYGRGALPIIEKQIDIKKNQIINGILRPAVALISPKMQRIDRVVNKVVTGLNYLITEKPLPDSHMPLVLYHAGTLRPIHDPEDKALTKAITILIDNSQLLYIGDPEIFAFRRYVAPDGPDTSVWQLCFYLKASYLAVIIRKSKISAKLADS